MPRHITVNQLAKSRLTGERLDSIATKNAQLLMQTKFGKDDNIKSAESTEYSSRFDVIRNAVDSQVNEMSKEPLNRSFLPAGSAVTSEAVHRINMALMTASRNDRRKMPRYTLSSPCNLTVENAAYPLQALDISANGIRLFGSVPPGIAIGTSVVVQLQNLGALNCHVKNNGRHGLNLAFCQPFTSSERAMIAGLLLALSAENDMLISRAKDMALAIQGVFENAIAENLTHEARLFSNSYHTVPETEPPQHICAAMEFYEAALPPLLERYFKGYRDVVYAVATDRNGYVPVHNTPFSLAQRADDPEYNLSYARNRRIYRDPTTLLASRFSTEAIIQCYPRDINCHATGLVLDASAPIMVRGRRWGCAQIAFLACR